MRTSGFVITASALASIGMAMPTPAWSQVSGFVQMRQAQRAKSLDVCTVEACSTMLQEALTELLIERRFGNQLSASLRLEANYDNALSEGHGRVREGVVDWAPGASLNLKLGRQILTWGVSDYLYVNDLFPKNYDSFFTGGGFDRMKEPVDGLRSAWHGGGLDVEAVVSRSKADRMPDPGRFTATAMSASAFKPDDVNDSADVAVKVATNVRRMDWAAYLASFRSRERVYRMDGVGLREERPRLQHLGVSGTGNCMGGLSWVEAALRHSDTTEQNVVSRHYLGSSFKGILGHSQEVGSDLSVSAQLQVEAPTSYGRYKAQLAAGVAPLERVTSTLHLRVHGRWKNQTVGAGAQVFVGNEGDSHFNPFVSWSPADGWTLEGGANVFNGKPDTRYGAFKDDTNVYILGRFSF